MHRTRCIFCAASALVLLAPTRPPGAQAVNEYTYNFQLNRVFSTPTQYIVVPLGTTNIPNVGDGFDLKTDERSLARCIRLFSVTQSQLNDIQSSLHQTIDTESTLRRLNTSLSAQGSYAGFSGGASSQETSETKTSFTGVNLVLHASIERRVFSIALPAASGTGGSAPADSTLYVLDIRPELKDLLNSPDGIKTFRRECGDGYVSAIVFGTEFYATLVNEVKSYQNKTTLEQSIQAGYSGDIFGAKASSSLYTEENSQSDTLDIRSFERGSGQSSLPISLDDLKKLYQQLPSLEPNAARPLYARVNLYTQLPSASTVGLPTPYVGLTLMTQTLLRMTYLQEVVEDALADAEKNDCTRFLCSIVDTTRRDLGPLKETRTSLLAYLSWLKGRIGECLKSSDAPCTYTNENFQDSTARELYYRARMPLPVVGVDPNVLTLLVNPYQNASAQSHFDILRQQAQCTLAEAVYQNNIATPTHVRCRDTGECVSDEILTTAATNTFSVMKDSPDDPHYDPQNTGVTMQQCKYQPRIIANNPLIKRRSTR